jgi:hypothetical protein
MKQSRRMSLVEAMVNVTVGYGLAVVIQILTFPIFGLQASLAQNLKLGLIFTAVSIARGYALRRVFEALHRGSAIPGFVIPRKRSGPAIARAPCVLQPLDRAAEQ